MLVTSHLSAHANPLARGVGRVDDSCHELQYRRFQVLIEVADRFVAPGIRSLFVYNEIPPVKRQPNLHGYTL